MSTLEFADVLKCNATELQVARIGHSPSVLATSRGGKEASSQARRDWTALRYRAWALAPYRCGVRSGWTDTVREMSEFSVVHASHVRDEYAGTNVPGEFRSLGDALGSEQLAVTLLRVPPHCDFEQGTGHYHEELEEIYVISRGTLTMRFGDEVRKVSAGSVVRVAPGTKRSHRNEGHEPVEMWAVSKRLGRPDAVKIDEFWEASPDAVQEREPG
jgi:mannose-6-phosphate isomerase-like protein (cupin superfamily)